MLVFFSCFFFILVLYTSILLSLMHKQASQLPKQNADYLLVLGARVIGTRMSRSLRMRAEVALHYLRQSPNTKVIVSGGQGPDEGISEAKALAKFFQQNGIKQSRILLEDRSTSTYENLLFSKRLFLNDDASVVIVTSDFHVFRAYYYATLLQYPHIETLASPTPNNVKGKMVIRELFAITWMWIKRLYR